MHDTPPATQNVLVASADQETRSSRNKGGDVRTVSPVVSLLNQIASASLLKHEWPRPITIARDATTVCHSRYAFHLRISASPRHSDPTTCHCATPSPSAVTAQSRMRWLVRFKTESFRAARLRIVGIRQATRRPRFEAACVAHFLHIPAYRADTRKQHGQCLADRTPISKLVNQTEQLILGVNMISNTEACLQTLPDRSVHLSAHSLSGRFGMHGRPAPEVRSGRRERWADCATLRVSIDCEDAQPQGAFPPRTGMTQLGDRLDSHRK